jgi:hypothetical protein
MKYPIVLNPLVMSFVRVVIEKKDEPNVMMGLFNLCLFYALVTFLTWCIFFFQIDHLKK